ncbi:hypothetical protein BDV06DRAFT_185482, partial [Aspergillus oleicola]
MRMLASTAPRLSTRLPFQHTLHHANCFTSQRPDSRTSTAQRQRRCRSRLMWAVGSCSGGGGLVVAHGHQPCFGFWLECDEVSKHVTLL